MALPQENKHIRLCILAMSCAVACLGAAVMAAWLTGGTGLVQLRADFAPMQFNTALCLFLSGISLAFARGGKDARRLSLASAALLGMIALATAAQYAFGANWGIDQLFSRAYLVTKTSHPGRMAPNTAFCFILQAASLLAWHAAKNAQARFVVPIVLDSIVFMLAVLALAGYIFGIEAAYGWWGFSNISPQTAVGLLLSAAAMLSIVRADDAHAVKLHRRWWLFALILSAGLTLTCLAAQGVLLGARKQAEALCAQKLEGTAQILRAELEGDIKALRRMQARLSASSAGLEGWRQDAQRYISDNSDYYAIAITDARFRPVATVPSRERQNAFSLNGNISTEGDKTFFIAKPPDSRLSSLVVFGFGLSGRADSQDYLLVAYDLGKRIAKILSLQKEASISLAVSEGGRTLFSSPTAREYPWKIGQENTIRVLDHEWKIEQVIDVSGYYDTDLIVFVLVAGGFLSFLLAYAAWQTDKAIRFSGEARGYQARLEAILDNMVDGMITISERGTVQSYNKACERIFGYGAGEVIGQNVKMLMPRSYAVQHDEYLSNYVGTGRKKIIGIGREVEGQRKDGSVFPLDLSVAEVRMGQGRFFSGIVRDITERRDAEIALKRSNEELEKFAYVASHDLKTPLRNIDDLARWTIEDTKDLLPPAAQKNLGMLRGRIAHLETLLADILSYSRAGRIADAPVSVDTHEMLSRLAETHVRPPFRVQIKGRLPVIMSPRTPLEQIFGNLLSNAVKHHDRKEGTIEVEAIPHESGFEFIVRDDGPGIPPQFQERAFQMFQTLRSQDEVPGSGLGLAIVKKLAEWRGGRAWIESDGQTRGTAVHFIWL